jgi:PEP-CTERM motif
MENGVISDALIVYGLPSLGGLLPTSAHAIFLSDATVAGAEPGPGLPLSCDQLNAAAGLTGVACTPMNGADSVKVTWSNGTTDTISYQSDAPGVVPEPASMVLLGSGLLALAGYVKKRI